MIRRLRETVIERLNRIGPARRLLQAAHEVLQEKTLRELSSRKSVVSIYHMRSSHWPRSYGLSDLDLALVVDGPTTAQPAFFLDLARTLIRTKKRYKLLDLKAVIVVQRSDFSQLCALNSGFYWAEGFPVDSWQLLSGPELRGQVGPRLRLSADTIAIAQHTYKHWPAVSRSQRKRLEKLAHLTGAPKLETPYDCYRALEQLAHDFSARPELNGDHLWKHPSWPWPQHFQVLPAGLSAADFATHFERWREASPSHNVRLLGNNLFQLYLQEYADFLTFVPWSLQNTSPASPDQKLQRAVLADLLMEKSERLIQAAIQQRTTDAHFLERKWHKYQCYLGLLEGALPPAEIRVPAAMSFSVVCDLLERTLAAYRARHEVA